VVSWSLLTVHMNPAIALQLVWGSYNGQQRLFTSKKDTKKHITSGPEFVFRIALTICSGLYNLDQMYFWKSCRAREEATGWEKQIPNKFLHQIRKTSRYSIKDVTHVLFLSMSLLMLLAPPYHLQMFYFCVL